MYLTHRVFCVMTEWCRVRWCIFLAFLRSSQNDGIRRQKIRETGARTLDVVLFKYYMYLTHRVLLWWQSDVERDDVEWDWDVPWERRTLRSWVSFFFLILKIFIWALKKSKNDVREREWRVRRCRVRWCTLIENNSVRFVREFHFFLI